MSHLQNKSSKLVEAASLLNKRNLYPAVAHSAYYCCVQLMKHIWIHSLHNKEKDFQHKLTLHNKNEQPIGGRNVGFHEFLINQIKMYIKSKNGDDYREFKNQIWQLKDLRSDADYSDNDFDASKSNHSLILSGAIVRILQKY